MLIPASSAVLDLSGKINGFIPASCPRNGLSDLALRFIYSRNTSALPVAVLKLSGFNVFFISLIPNLSKVVAVGK